MLAILDWMHIARQTLASDAIAPKRGRETPMTITLAVGRQPCVISDARDCMRSDQI